MHRPNSSSSRASKDHHAIDVSDHYTGMTKQEPKKPSASSPPSRKRPDFVIDFPIPGAGGGRVDHRKENSRAKSSRKKWIYLIALLLLLLFVIVLCYFFNTAELDIKDLTAIRQGDVPQFVNETHFAHISLAKALISNASVSPVARATY